MKYLKMLALAAVAAGALTVFVEAGTASATVLCSTTMEPCPEAQRWSSGTVLDFSLASGTSLIQQAGENVLKTCKGSTIKGKITVAGDSTRTVSGEITELTWKECTHPTVTVLKGGFEIHHIAGASNGTVTANEEITWTTNNPLFGSCIYGLISGDEIGTLTEGKPATLDVNAVIRRTQGSVCPETATWTATYTLTGPSSTTLSVGAS